MFWPLKISLPTIRLGVKKTIVEEDLSRNVTSLASLWSVVCVSDTAPERPITGLVYYDTTLSQPFIWDGAEWKPFLTIPVSTVVPIADGAYHIQNSFSNITFEDGICTAFVYDDRP